MNDFKVEYIKIGDSEYWVKRNPKYDLTAQNIANEIHIYHRDDDLPAAVTPTTEFWYQNGKMHRENDKPAYIYKKDGNGKTQGLMQWRRHGRFYREHGPSEIAWSVASSGKRTEQYRYINNALVHRLNGAALDWKGPSPYVGAKKKWALYGNEVNKKEYLSWLKENGIELDNITETDMILINLKWNKKNIELYDGINL